jgi:hypothetical protein
MNRLIVKISDPKSKELIVASSASKETTFSLLNLSIGVSPELKYPKTLDTVLTTKGTIIKPEVQLRPNPN